MTIRVWLYSVAAFCGSVALTGIVRFRMNAPVPPISNGLLSNVDSAISAFRLEQEVVLVYVGRESCAWCRRPELREAVDSIVVLLKHSALAEKRGFRFFGVGVDLEPQASVRHLSKFRGFHAWSVGDGWNSLTGDLLVSGRLAGPRATPQLLVMIREKRIAGSEKAGFAEVLRESIVVRKVGLGEIEEWLEAGAKLPAGSVEKRSQ